MIFAAIDYVQYRLRLGTYGNGKSSNLMGISCIGGFPTDLLSEMVAGDLIFTQRLDSAFAWATMYVSNSYVDHSAIYIGNGNIAHVTLNGLKQHRIGVFGSNTRVIGARYSFAEKWTVPEALLAHPPHFDSRWEGGKIAEGKSWTNLLRPKAQLVFVGFQIIFGFYPDRFRWRLFFDLWFLSTAIDVVAYLASGYIGATLISVLSLLSILINQAILKLRRILKLPYPILSHPDLLLRTLYIEGGIVFSKLGAVVIIGRHLLPLKAAEALGLRRESPDYRADNEF